MRNLVGPQSPIDTGFRQPIADLVVVSDDPAHMIRYDSQTDEVAQLPLQLTFVF